MYYLSSAKWKITHLLNCALNTLLHILTLIIRHLAYLFSDSFEKTVLFDKIENSSFTLRNFKSVSSILEHFQEKFFENMKEKKAKMIGDSSDKFQPISKSPTMTY